MNKKKMVAVILIILSIIFIISAVFIGSNLTGSRPEENKENSVGSLNIYVEPNEVVPNETG